VAAAAAAEGDSKTHKTSIRASAVSEMSSCHSVTRLSLSLSLSLTLVGSDSESDFFSENKDEDY
jgi:hypothetical protein